MKLCHLCGQPTLPKGKKRQHPDDYRHAQGCPYSRAYMETNPQNPIRFRATNTRERDRDVRAWRGANQAQIKTTNQQHAANVREFRAPSKTTTKAHNLTK